MVNEMKMVIQELKQLRTGLNRIENEIIVIRKKFIDPDTKLDRDDIKAIEEANKEFREGRLIPFDKLKQELKL